MFVNKGTSETGMFIQTSQELLTDLLDHLCMQYVIIDTKELDLKQVISNDLKTFPNIFLPLFEISPNAQIMTKVQHISRLIGFMSEI